MNINSLAKRLPIIVILIVSAFFGCVGPFTGNHTDNSSEHSGHSPMGAPAASDDARKSGMVRLFVNEQNARTILPTFNGAEAENQFQFFNIIFIAKDSADGGRNAYFPVSGTLSSVKGYYLIAEGRYEKVIIEAFYSPECNSEYLGAIGESGEFLVTSSGANVTVVMDVFNSDKLKPEGVFKWNIINTLNTPAIGIAGDVAVMKITPKTCGVNSYEINLITDGFNSECAMDSGIYDISFEYSRDGCASVKFSEILYIARGGAVSSYSDTIPKLASLTANVTFNLNNPGDGNVSLGTLAVGEKIEGSILAGLPAYLLDSYSNDFDLTEKFKGWYKDKAGTKEWDFSFDRVLSDTTLYAKWEATNEITSPTGIVLKSIGGGTFTMGSPPSEPDREGSGALETQHQVTLNGFYISKYLVTQEQYQKVMGSNPSGFNYAVPGESGTPGKLPVERVNWYDAIVFCNKLSVMDGLTPVYTIGGSTNPDVWGTAPTAKDAAWDAVTMVAGANGYRLPTEAEWEYACRAGTLLAYNVPAPNGSNTPGDKSGWYTANAGGRTHQVGLKPANNWGLYDMPGNVWQWCWDWFAWDLGSAPAVNPSVNNPTGQNRVTRGVSWYNGETDFLRSAARSQLLQSSRYLDLGFRIVRGL